MSLQSCSFTSPKPTPVSYPAFSSATQLLQTDTRYAVRVSMDISPCHGPYTLMNRILHVGLPMGHAARGPAAVPIASLLVGLPNARLHAGLPLPLWPGCSWACHCPPHHPSDMGSSLHSLSTTYIPPWYSSDSMCSGTTCTAKPRASARGTNPSSSTCLFFQAM